MLMTGAMLDRRSWLAAALWIVLVGFLVVKAHWEERRMAETYPGYERYQKAVAAFVPIPGRAQS